jgi:hypothetical protein
MQATTPSQTHAALQMSAERVYALEQEVAAAWFDPTIGPESLEELRAELDAARAEHRALEARQ